MASYRPNDYSSANKPLARKGRWNNDNNPRKRSRSRSPGHYDQKSDKKKSRAVEARNTRPFRDYERSKGSESYREREDHDSDKHSGQQYNEPDHVDHEVSNNSNRKPKTKKDRKENPSSRIHSLRRLIARGQLPPPVQAEKERELASLLHEQKQTELRKLRRTNLERYHFIRFMERQKAQRVLKKLRKQKMNGAKLDQDGRDIDTRLQDAETDLNYTLYAPLAEKYISIFVEYDKSGNPVNKAQKYKHAWKLMKQREMNALDAAQRETLQRESMETANLYEMNIKPSNLPGESEDVPKPPTWYEVKEAMKGGQTKLDTLRDRQKPIESKDIELVVGLKASGKESMEWLHDDGKIDEKDLDSETDSDGGGDQDMADGGVNVGGTQRHTLNDDIDDNDEDMSDGDGGFFEKRQ